MLKQTEELQSEIEQLQQKMLEDATNQTRQEESSDEETVPTQ